LPHNKPRPTYNIIVFVPSIGWSGSTGRFFQVGIGAGNLYYVVRMKRHSCFRVILITGLFAVTVLCRGQTNTIVLPREAEVAFGNAKDDPLFLGYFEQIYASSEFSDLPIDTILITRIAFRIDETEQRLTNFGGGVVLRMNTFHGSLEDIVQRKTGRQEPEVTVFEENEFVIPGQPGELAFDIRLHLKKPFLYDRRLGHLVLTIDSTGGRGIVDAWAVSADRGFYIYLHSFLEGYKFESHMLSTEFSYIIPPNIQVIHKFKDDVQIVFSFSGASETLRVEGSNTLNGPYAPIENAELKLLSSSSMRANIPVSTGKQFFRIRQASP
jgi:hypothetical protein